MCLWNSNRVKNEDIHKSDNLIESCNENIDLKISETNFREHLFNLLLKVSLHKKWSFPLKDFFSKCDQIRSFLGIWSHLLKKSLMENFIFCGVYVDFGNLMFYNQAAPYKSSK